MAVFFAGRLRAAVFLRVAVFFRVAVFLRVAGRFRAAVFLRAPVFLRAVDLRAPVFLRAVDFRAVVFLRAVDFLAVDLFFVAFLAPEDAFLAGLTYAAFRQRRALRVAPAYESPVSFDDAFRAGAAGLTVPPLLYSSSSYEELAETLMLAALCAGCTTSRTLTSAATLSSNSNVFNAVTTPK